MGGLKFQTDCSFFFPSMLIGPSLDYATYNSLITHTIYSTPPPGTGAEQAKATKRRIPYGRKRVAYLHLAIGLSFLGFYAVYGGRGSYTRVLGDDWGKWSMLTKFGFVQFAAFVAKSKYYAVWSMSEVGVEVCRPDDRARVSSPVSDSMATTRRRGERCGIGCAM